MSWWPGRTLVSRSFSLRRRLETPPRLHVPAFAVANPGSAPPVTTSLRAVVRLSPLGGGPDTRADVSVDWSYDLYLQGPIPCHHVLERPSGGCFGFACCEVLVTFFKSLTVFTHSA